MQPTPSGKKIKCQGRKIRCFLCFSGSSTIVVEDSLRNYSFSFRLENPGNKSFRLCLHRTKIPTQLHSKRLWWPQWTVLCLALSSPKRKTMYKHNICLFPWSKHNPNIYGRLQGATWYRSQVTINDTGNSPELVQDVCCQETMSRGKQSYWSLGNGDTKWTDRCSHINTI